MSAFIDGDAEDVGFAPEFPETFPGAEIGSGRRTGEAFCTAAGGAGEDIGADVETKGLGAETGTGLDIGFDKWGRFLSMFAPAELGGFPSCGTGIGAPSEVGFRARLAASWSLMVPWKRSLSIDVEVISDTVLELAGAPIPVESVGLRWK